MRTALALFLIIPAITVAEPREVAVVTINNEEAKLFDDGTWAFVNSGVAMPVVGTPRCLATADGRLSVCPDPAHWATQIVSASPGVEKHTLNALDSAYSLTAVVDASYGHSGDLAFYEENVGDGGLLGRLASRTLGLGSFSDQSFVTGDVAVVLSAYTDTDADYNTNTIEILTRDQSLYLDLVAVPTIPGFTEKAAGFDPVAARTSAVQSLYETVTIDGQTLGMLIQGQQE